MDDIQMIPSAVTNSSQTEADQDPSTEVRQQTEVAQTDVALTDVKMTDVAQTDDQTDSVPGDLISDQKDSLEAEEKPSTSVKPEDKGTVETSGAGPDIDTLAYLKRDEFTSEIFKIEINNLPKHCGINQLRKKLVSLNLKPGKVKVLNNSLFAFVNFKCEEERQKALEVLDGHHWKGRDMKVKKANPAQDPLLRKRKQDMEDAEGVRDAKVGRAEPQDSIIPINERLNDAVSGLWRIPYEEQLQRKSTEIRTFIKRLGREIEKTCFDVTLKDWLRSQFRQHKGLCCNLLSIKPSPVLNNYRNKCEFTIGQSPEGKDKTVGFRLGRYKGGVVSVVEPDNCLIISDRMKQCCRSLQHFLQTESSQPGFEPESKTGNWKMVLVRSNRRGDIMMVVYFVPQKLTEDVIAVEKVKLQNYFTTGVGQDTPITSLYFRVQSDRHEHEENAKCELLKGEKHIDEDLMGLKFRISPSAFFQVNTEAAEVLYSTVADWCSISSNTMLLDVCCGTGTIGLTMAKRVKKVVGIEMCKDAVDDAKVNAEINRVTNAQFYCGKAEDLLPVMIKQYQSDDVIAVVDPPRAGLHQDVVRAIRRCEGVKRLVYVSCKATGALNNLIDITRTESKRVRGAPFRMVQAVPVDLFPHTAHVELVMLFERATDGDSANNTGNGNTTTQKSDTTGNGNDTVRRPEGNESVSHENNPKTKECGVKEVDDDTVKTEDPQHQMEES